MDDIRRNDYNQKLQMKIRRVKTLKWFSKNWYKIILLLILIFIISFPTISGELIGHWISNFYSSILKNITF